MPRYRKELIDKIRLWDYTNEDRNEENLKPTVMNSTDRFVGTLGQMKSVFGQTLTEQLSHRVCNDSSHVSLRKSNTAEVVLV